MEAFVQGLSALASVSVLLGLLVGVVSGMLVGAFPGLTATMAVAVASSFTLTLDPQQGLAVLLGIYIAALFGDRVPAILVNTPGTPASIASTFDGFPMAQQGRAGVALAVSAIGSFVGGLVGIAVFALAAFPLAGFASRFGAPEFFALVVFGLTMMVSVSGASVLKGLIAGLVGLLVATVGLDPILGSPRYTFGSPQLQSGVAFIPVIIGLFGIAEVLDQFLTRGRERAEQIVAQIGRSFPNAEERRRMPKPILIGSVIGSVIGAIPAAGGDIAGLISWDRAKRMSKNPEEFGKGSIEGLTASDTANNAVVGGAMITTLALGVPGDSVTAVLLGSMLIWGIQPGPDLFVEDPALVYTIVGLMVLATVLALVLSFVRLKSVVKLLDLPRPLLWSGIVLFCAAGTFAVQNSLFDVWLMFGAGVVGLAFRRLGFPAGPVVLGLLLGPLAEANFRRTLIISDGPLDAFLGSPIALLLLAFSALAVILPILRSRRQRSDGA